MGELTNTIDNMANRLKENAKIIDGQADRIEYWIREFEALGGKIEKIEEENKKLKEELEKAMREKEVLMKQK